LAASRWRTRAMTEKERGPAIAGERFVDRVRVPPGAPVFYADQLVDVVYGIYTSKLVFGAEDGSAAGIRPVVTVVVPTPTLLMACLRVANDITLPNMIDETSGRFNEAVETMRELRRFFAQDYPKSDSEKSAGS
jgi:hypothetical protein